MLTEVPGSSHWFDVGFVVYANAIKQQVLNVQTQTLERYGAVSQEVVEQMVQGVFKHSQVNLAAAISGVAGPDGGSEDKPVGTVWFAWARRDQPAVSQCFHFQGNRRLVRDQAVFACLKGFLPFFQY